MYSINFLKTKNMHITLYRSVKGRLRYYTIKLYPTLFNEYLLVREFGGVKNKKPTRSIKVYFSLLDDAMLYYQTIIQVKIKKGYHLL